jgi:phage-related protein
MPDSLILGSGSSIGSFTAGSALTGWGWQIGDGILLGPDTPYGVITVDGFLDQPDIRVDSSERLGDHGSFVFGNFLTERTITMTGDVTGDTDHEFISNVYAMKAAMLPTNVEIPLRGHIPGAGTLVSFCIPVRYNLPTNFETGIHYGLWAMQFIAGDPRIYDDDVQQVFSGASYSYGMHFSHEFGSTGVDFLGGVDGSVSVTNEGIFPTPPIIDIYGPCSNPQVINITQSKMIRLNTTLAEGDVVTFDFDAKTIFLNGDSSVYSSLDDASEWWELPPGETTVQFRIDDVGPGTAQMRLAFRSAWV